MAQSAGIPVFLFTREPEPRRPSRPSVVLAPAVQRLGLVVVSLALIAGAPSLAQHVAGPAVSHSAR